jgi:hypothetical protein
MKAKSRVLWLEKRTLLLMKMKILVVLIAALTPNGAQR